MFRLTAVRRNVFGDLLKKLKVHPDALPSLEHKPEYRRVAPGSQPKEQTPDGPESREFDRAYWNRDTRRMLDKNLQNVVEHNSSLKAAAVYTDVPDHLPRHGWMRKANTMADHEEWRLMNDLPPTAGIIMGDNHRAHSDTMDYQQKHLDQSLNQ